MLGPLKAALHSLRLYLLIKISDIKQPNRKSPVCIKQPFFEPKNVTSSFFVVFGKLPFATGSNK